jgi:sRNA-binding regulator protein Hfq
MSTRVSASDDKSTKNIEIQLLTQADFDAMTEPRQAFIRDRIKAGQVKIVSLEELAPPAPKPSPATRTNKQNPKMNQNQKPKPDETQSKPTNLPARPYIHPSPIRRLVGKPVKIVLNDGHVRTGTLTELWQFELVLKNASDTEIILMKHASTSFEEDMGKTGC